jgi:hypothetical protein
MLRCDTVVAEQNVGLIALHLLGEHLQQIIIATRKPRGIQVFQGTGKKEPEMMRKAIAKPG